MFGECLFDLRRVGKPAHLPGEMTRLSFAEPWLSLPNISGILWPMSRNWQRLARAVSARRAELGVSQDTVHDRGGPSDIVLGRIERDEDPRPRNDTINKLDAGLEWQPGSAQRVLAGGDPVPLQPGPTHRTVRRYEDGSVPLVADLREVPSDALMRELQRRMSEPWDGRERRRGDPPTYNPDVPPL